jgi:hypothetical protein
MAGYSEVYGKLKIEQIQVEGWVEGTYNTHITYCDKVFGIKYHFNATYREIHKKIDPAATLYNMTNGIDIIARCNLYKNLLDDILHLELKMEMKAQNGLKYNFDMNFVRENLRKIVNTVHDDVQNIYMDLQFEAASKGMKFYIPLPNYTIENETEGCAENNQSTDIALLDNRQNDFIELIKKDTTLIIELLKELQQKNSRPPYINELMQQGYIATDGKTVFTSLDNIVESLFTKIESVTPQLLVNTFLQTNGSKFALRTAQDAIQRNKAQ